MRQITRQTHSTANVPEYTEKLQARSKGQTLVIISMVMLLLILFMGLGIDAGNLMGRRAKLQSAVDSAALSSAQALLAGTNVTQTATIKAYQILEANGVASSTLMLRQVDFPSGGNLVHVKATQRVDTFFMKVIPAFRQVDVTAEATADINSYAEVNAKPYGIPGVVNELNISVWGVNSWRAGGDAYSPMYVGGWTQNDQYPKQPYGYLYRIDVPPGYAYSHVVVQIFDPDSYNRPDYPPAWPTPGPTGTPTPSPGPDQYASCTQPSHANCSSNDARYNPGLNLNAFPDGRAAFWRADEVRTPHDVGSGIGSAYNDTYLTRATFTLWHFDPHITTAFADPSTLSDQPSGAYLALYDNNTHQTDAFTDLRWYQPNGFDVQLTGCGGGDCFAREANGGFYFYLYVQGTGGSSENNFDLRVGPAHSQVASNDACTDGTLGGNYTTDCYVNKLYYDNSFNGKADWTTGGASIFAKRAMPLNLDTGDHFPMLFSQVNKKAAGQLLGVRHFDQDCTGGCGPSHTMQYQMQTCVLVSGSYQPCPNTLSDSCFHNVATGYVGPNDGWQCPGCPDPDPVQIPAEGTTGYGSYADFFGPNGECSTSWLRLQSDPSYTQDTTVWEMPFIRPRLIK